MNRTSAKAVLATMHRKEQVMQPLLETGLSLDIFVPTDFDTDQFGTFTREKTRHGNQLEAARKKARAAMKKYGYQVGIASEGSFGMHPSILLLPSNLELVVLIDDTQGIEVVGQARSSKVLAQGKQVQSVSEALACATEWGFPDQGVILRRSEQSTRNIYKDITTKEELAATAQQLLRWPWARSLYLETDMRAHRCPARMETIAAATRDLVARYNVHCPECAAPGFQPVSMAGTATCQRCQLPTDVPYTQTHECQRCQHQAVMPIVEAPATVSPGECARCNP